MKKILSIFLSILMIAASFAVMAVPASADEELDEFDLDFEDGITEGIADVNGNGYDGTCILRTNFDACITNDAHNANKYYKLTGSSNYMNISLNGSNSIYTYALPENDFIFSYDLRIPVSGLYEVRLFNPYLSGETQVFTVFTDDGQLKVNNDEANQKTINFAANIWHNISIAVSDSMYTLYVDGIEVAESEKDDAKNFSTMRLGVNGSISELNYDNFKIYEGTTPKAPDHLALMNAVDGIGFVGTQVGTLAATDGSIRLVGVIAKELSAYADLGFKVECNNASVDTEITKAYTSIGAGNETVEASVYGGKYFFTFVISDVPANTELKITPFAQLTNAESVYASASYTVTVE